MSANITQTNQSPNTQLTFSQREIQMIHKQCAAGTNEAEFQHFIYVAALRGLNPLASQIYCIVRGQGERRKVTHQVGIDGFRAIADKTERYAGSDDAFFTEGDHQPYTHPETATVTVYKIVAGMRCAFTATARWDEYKPAPGSSGNGDVMWRKMPYGQLSKCAEAKALRKAFPQDLSGFYAPEEMEQANTPYIEKPVKQIIDVRDYKCSPEKVEALIAGCRDARSAGVTKEELERCLPKGRSGIKQLNDEEVEKYLDDVSSLIEIVEEAKRSEQENA